MNENKTPCEVCLKVKPSVRFEGIFEGYICDSCLNEFLKGGLK